VEAEEHCGPKSSLTSNHCGHAPTIMHGHLKVISREGLSEKELMPNTLRFHRKAKGKVAGAIKPAPGS
jgi:hypothetical protein